MTRRVPISKYRYTARNDSGELVTGALDADDCKLALEELSRRGVFPVEIAPQTDEKSDRKRSLQLRRGISSGELVHFYRQLSDLIGSGVALSQAISVLRKMNVNNAFIAVVDHLKQEISRGTSLSVAMSRRSDTFSEMETSLISAAEATGTLEESLARLADVKERQCALRVKIRSSLAYPALLLVVSGIALIVLVVFVLPELAKLFGEMGQELPFPTRVVLRLGEFARFAGPVVLLIALAVVLVVKPRRLANIVKRGVTRVLLHAPIVRDIIIKAELAGYSLTLSSLLRSGVSVLRACRIAADSVHDKQIRASLSQVVDKVSRGRKLGDSLQTSPYISHTFVTQISVGEESSRLEETLSRIAETCRRDVDLAVQLLTSLIEPAMIIIVGIVVGFIILSVILPVFSLDIGGIS